MKGLLIVLLYCMFSPVLAAPIEVTGKLRILEPKDNHLESTQAVPLYDFAIRRGNFESHAREGYPHYRGVPWNLLVAVDPQTNLVRTTVWIDDKDLWFTDDDEALVVDEFDAGTLVPRALELYKFADGAVLQLVLIPEGIPPALEPIELTERSFGLDRFCLKHAKVIMDDTFVLGAVSGFGEKVVVDIPELALVSMSLSPLYDWKPIGTYEDGVVKVPLEDGHELSVSGVRVGPEGNVLGGPFTVFGAIEASDRLLRDVRKQVEEELAKQHEGKRLEALLAAFRANPFGALGRITVGNAEGGNENLDRYAGLFGKKLNACSAYEAN